jgi:hypothetical protein
MVMLWEIQSPNDYGHRIANASVGHGHGAREMKLLTGASILIIVGQLFSAELGMAQDNDRTKEFLSGIQRYDLEKHKTSWTLQKLISESDTIAILDLETLRVVGEGAGVPEDFGSAQSLIESRRVEVAAKCICGTDSEGKTDKIRLLLMRWRSNDTFSSGPVLVPWLSDSEADIYDAPRYVLAF